MNHMRIDAQITVPVANIGRPAYPFRDLSVGESFFVLGGKSLNVGYWHKQTGYRYTTRSVTENGRTGIRVWRVV